MSKSTLLAILNSVFDRGEWSYLRFFHFNPGKMRLDIHSVKDKSSQKARSIAKTSNRNPMAQSLLRLRYSWFCSTCRQHWASRHRMKTPTEHHNNRNTWIHSRINICYSRNCTCETYYRIFWSCKFSVKFHKIHTPCRVCSKILKYIICYVLDSEVLYNVCGIHSLNRS